MSTVSLPLKNVLTLHDILLQSLPKSYYELWVTSDEIRERLVHAGVSPLFTNQNVEDAVSWWNRGECLLKKRMFQHVYYYWPPSVDGKGPDSQRWKDDGLPDQNFHKFILPPEKHLVTNPKAGGKLTTLNNALIKAEEETIKAQKAKLKPETKTLNYVMKNKMK